MLNLILPVLFAKIKAFYHFAHENQDRQPFSFAGLICYVYELVFQLHIVTANGFSGTLWPFGFAVLAFISLLSEFQYDRRQILS